MDEYGDMTPVLEEGQLIDGDTAIALAIDARLALGRGEWWENRNHGFKAPDIMVEAARKGNTEMITQYITGYLNAMPEVRAVEDVEVETVDQTLYISCTVRTTDGTVQVEVNEDGIFSAIY